jgi:hypothetical protein
MERPPIEGEGELEVIWFAAPDVRQLLPVRPCSCCSTLARRYPGKSRGRKPATFYIRAKRQRATAGRMPAKNAQRRRDSGSKGLSRRNLTLGILAGTRNPPTASPSGPLQRVSITDSSEPALCHQQWIAPQGATPAEPHHNTRS